MIGALGAAAGFFVSGLTEYNWRDSEVVMVLWALMALPFVVERTGIAAAASAPTGASTRGRSPSGP